MITCSTNWATFYICGDSSYRIWVQGSFHPLLYHSELNLQFVEPTGYDPVPLDFQSSAMTTSATAPFGCMTGNDPAIFIFTEWRLYHFVLTHHIFCDPGGLRSHSPHIKSMVLSRLSYEVIFFARVPRFELGTTLLESGMIPFHYTRVFIFVERVGIEPTPLDFQSSAITWSATSPI